jgi:hypothetical protein
MSCSLSGETETFLLETERFLLHLAVALPPFRSAATPSSSDIFCHRDIHSSDSLSTEICGNLVTPHIDMFKMLSFENFGSDMRPPAGVSSESAKVSDLDAFDGCQTRVSGCVT